MTEPVNFPADTPEAESVQHEQKSKDVAYKLTFFSLVVIAAVGMIAAVTLALTQPWSEKDLLEANETIARLTGDNQRLATIRDDQNLTIHALTTAVELLRTTLEDARTPTAWQPALGLSPWQETLCLSILLYGEERQGTEEDMVKIANVVYNRVNVEDYANNACLVASGGLGSQFSSMKPYLGDIKRIVWGELTSYTPKLAKEDPIELRAWKKIAVLSKAIVEGKKPHLTDATDFIAPAEVKTWPSWVRAFRPCDVTTGHVLFCGYEEVNGKTIRYTKEKPYKQANYVKRLEARGKS